MKASNITEFVQKVAQAYKRRPSNMMMMKQVEQRVSTEDSYLTDGMASEVSSSGVATPSRSRSAEELEVAAAAAAAAAAGAADPSLLAVKVRVLETLVTNIFSTISALKSAYVQLQAAHSPYDAAALEMADKAVIAELRRLSDLKQSYVERDAIVSAGQPPREPDAILKSYEGIINNFHAEIRTKNAEVESLKDMLAESTLQREKLERRLKRLEQKLSSCSSSPASLPALPPDSSSASSSASPNADLLRSAVLRASEVSKSFTKLLISLMKAAQWDLDAASDSIEPGIHYARRSHRKYAFESYVCQQMWNGFENDDFYIFGSLSSILDPDKHRRECFDEFLDMRTIDPLELISVNPDCLFGKFCHKKFLQLVHPKMETSFFGNFEHRNQITDGAHPNSQFYQSFLRLAKAVWLVHRLAFAFNPTVSIFQVKRGNPFSPLCMESLVPSVETEEQSLPAKVGFSVMPGFRVEKGVVKCQVYLEATGKTIG